MSIKINTKIYVKKKKQWNGFIVPIYLDNPESVSLSITLGPDVSIKFSPILDLSCCQNLFLDILMDNVFWNHLKIGSRFLDAMKTLWNGPSGIRFMNLNTDCPPSSYIASESGWVSQNLPQICTACHYAVEVHKCTELI